MAIAAPLTGDMMGTVVTITRVRLRVKIARSVAWSRNERPPASLTIIERFPNDESGRRTIRTPSRTSR
jgi:hypothetical protein